MVAAPKEEKTIALQPVARKAPWVAVIYVPGEEVKALNQDNLITGVGQQVKTPVLRSFSAPLTIPEGHKPGQNISIRTFSLHPGTNLGIHSRLQDDREIIDRLSIDLWEAVMSKPIDRRLLDIGALRIFYPENWDEFGEPGYRHFATGDALQLVQAHMHQKWIDRALIGEDRPEVKTAADNRKQQITRIQNQLRSGN